MITVGVAMNSRSFTVAVCLAIFFCTTWLGVRALEDSTTSQSNNQPTEPIKVEFDSIRFLHQLLDEDLSGYVDVRESDEFLKDELNLNGKSKEKLNKFHHDDPQITVEELWGSWRVSEVHNWTVEQVVEWLVQHVELPQYAEIFRRLAVNGSQLPRLASNSPEYLTTTLGIRDPIHKRKLSLKATDAVLFGSPKRDPLGAYKNWIFVTSIGIASCGIWFAYSQRRKYDLQMHQVSADLENFQQLERQLSSLQERVGKTDTGVLKDGHDDGKSGPSSVDGNRLHEVEEELSVLRDALQRAELRAESRAWSVPVELELHLRKTYNVELAYFRSKRAATEKQLQAAKEECEKLHKKQQGVFGPFRVAHGSQLDTVDDGLVVAKAALTELAADMSERSTRWTRMEILTGLNIVSPNASTDGAYLRRQFPTSASIPAAMDFADHSGVSMVSSRLTRQETQDYDRYGRRLSWEADNFSVNSYDSMPVNFTETARSIRGDDQTFGKTGDFSATPIKLAKVDPQKVLNCRPNGSSDDEDRATRKVPDARDSDSVSVTGADTSVRASEKPKAEKEKEKKKSALKKLFG